MDTLESVKVLRINFMILLKTMPLVSQYTMVAAVCRVEVQEDDVVIARTM